MDPTLGELVVGLEGKAAGADVPTLLGLLGDVERLKAVLWQRLVATTIPADSMDHSAGDVDERGTRSWNQKVEPSGPEPPGRRASDRKAW
jgi:hypothetical protein